MNNIATFNQPANLDPFGLSGSIVDFPIKSEKGNLPHFHHKKAVYAVEDDGEILRGLGIVGRDYPVTAHVDFFERQHDMLARKLPQQHVEKAETKYSLARDGAFAKQDITFPSIRVPIETYKHKTDIGLRYIAWHGVDGLTSNNGIFGAIDFFCSNGMITGEYDVVRKKNTKNFSLAAFVDEVELSVDNFYEQHRVYQSWAARRISGQQVKELFEAFPVSKRKARELLAVYHTEAAVRGETLWTVYSTLTNYSSHTNNGFELRQTGGDHAAHTMLKREFEVSKLVNSEPFQQLAA